ncbi:MAG: right-handed parallel beta-helix repeat-containing protein, partial [Candidatus Hodarchaeales archaeon]
MSRTFSSIITILFLFTIVTTPFSIISSIHIVDKQFNGVESETNNDGDITQEENDNPRSDANYQGNIEELVGQSIDRNNERKNRISGSSGEAAEYISRNELIEITSDQNFTDTANLPSNNWPGTGTKDNPIIIENYNITRTDVPSFLIKIENVTLHFIIRNCFLKGALTLMKFINTSNGLIIGNQFAGDLSFYEFGINFDSNSSYNVIKYNNFELFQGNENGTNANNDNVTNTFIYNYWDDNLDNEGNDRDYDGIYDGPYVYIQGDARLPDAYSRVYKENWNHLPINLTSNEELEEFISDEGWLGNGTAINPYTISNVNITILNNNTLKGIILENIDLYVKIDSCFIEMTGSNTAIDTDSVNNLLLLNNTVVDAPYGFWIENSNDTTTLSNTFIRCKTSGAIFQKSHNASIINNTALYCWFGIYVSYSDHARLFNNTVQFSNQTAVYFFRANFCTTENLTIKSSLGWGMYLNQANNCTIVNSTFTENVQDGIYSENGKNQIFTSCNISSNGRYGVYSNSDNETYDDSVIDNNTIGVYFRWADNCSLTNLKITDNRGDGIQANYTESLTLINVNSSWNGGKGLLLYYNSFANISSSFFNDNNLTGIYLLGSNNNEILDCDIIDNDVNGLKLVAIESPDSYEANSSYNVVRHNTIENNTGHGIYCTNSLDTTGSEGYDMTISFNIFMFNTISGNSQLGIYLNATVDNTIANNSFIDNGGTSQGYDNDPANSNEFIYNHWSDWEGPDNDGNGIGDTPYEIDGGSNTDAYPVIYAWQVIPSTTHVNVNITYPNGGETLNQTVTVIWTVNDTSSEWTYSVEYSSDGGETWLESGTMTSDNSTVEFEWNTTQLTDASGYSLKVTITDDDVVGSDETDGTFSIDNSGSSGQTVPINVNINITSPEDGSTVSGNVNITWTASDPPAEVIYEVSYSKDAGDTWNVLGNVTTLFYSWNTTGDIDGLRYRIRVNI